MDDLRQAISELWLRRTELSPADGDAREVVDEAVGALDRGEVRVAEIDPESDEVVVHEWLRQAILLLFILSDLTTGEYGPFEYTDRLPLKHGLC